MELVNYSHRFRYRSPQGRSSFPILPLRLELLGNHENALDVDGYLDSGAQYSLFSGELAPILGIDLLSGARRDYASTAGAHLEGRLHTVRVSNEEIGSFTFEIGFSVAPITRNLLGRDFFNLVQIGFRERRQEFFLTFTP